MTRELCELCINEGISLIKKFLTFEVVPSVKLIGFAHSVYER